VRESQGMNIQAVTSVQYGRLHAPLAEREWGHGHVCRYNHARCSEYLEG
jgi:hypothetical protein